MVLAVDSRLIRPCHELVGGIPWYTYPSESQMGWLFPIYIEKYDENWWKQVGCQPFQMEMDLLGIQAQSVPSATVSQDHTSGHRTTHHGRRPSQQIPMEWMQSGYASSWEIQSWLQVVFCSETHKHRTWGPFHNPKNSMWNRETCLKLGADSSSLE